MDTKIKKWEITKNNILKIITTDVDDQMETLIRIDKITALQATQQNDTATVDIYLDYHTLSFTFDNKPFLGKNKGPQQAFEFISEVGKNMEKKK